MSRTNFDNEFRVVEPEGSPRTNIEEFRKVLLASTILIIGIVTIVGFTILAFGQGNLLLALANIAISLCLIGLLFHLRITRNTFFTTLAGLTMLGFYYLFLFCSGGTEATAWVWIYTYPLVALFVLGKRVGTIYSLLLIFFALIAWTQSAKIGSIYPYPKELIIRVIPSYLCVVAFTFVLEHVRSIVQGRLAQANLSLELTVLELEKTKDELNELSIRDGLTGLYNRRYFDEVLKLSINQAVRNRTDLSLMIIDIDFFKKFNDRYGHIAGDHVLKEFAGILTKSIRRKTDMVFRYGGEEFTIILTNTMPLFPQRIATDIQTRLARQKIRHEDSPHNEILTASIGAAFYYHLDLNQPEELIKRADSALYEAKKEGRNRFIFAAQNT